MANLKKTSKELRVMAGELIEKAKAMITKADQLDHQEELELLRAIKKAGKLEEVKLLLAKQEPYDPKPKADNSKPDTEV